MTASAMPLMNGWSVVAVLTGLASLSLFFIWIISRRQWRARERMRDRARELEALLELQEQKVQHLTAFAEQIQEREAGTRAIIENALDGIITIDHHGRIVAFNPAAERMFGYQAEEVLGQPLDACIIPHSLRREHRRGLAHFVETGDGPYVGRRIETLGLRQDDREFPIELSLMVLHLQQPPRMTAYVRDITESKRAEEELRQARDAAESANRAKSDFLANVSHEIRTPMNGILGMTQLALDTDLSDEQREYLQLVKASADGLLIVINDFLDFSKIEAGKLELDPVAFELRDSLADTLRTLNPRANAKDLELACHVPAEVPDFLVGDPDRLRQVLVNLVGNALKFTDQGEVVVRVRMAEESARNAEGGPPTPRLQPGGDIALYFSVSDTGIGIAPGKLPHIFDAFVQADSSTTRKYGGTGLGLTITGRLVEMMGGRLWAESEPGRGSTFHFSVRFKLQDRSPSRLLPRKPPNLRGLPVLVVDDNATNRRILEELLAGWLMTPRTADGAQAALAELEAAAARNEPFALVLLDAHMPERDGFALAVEIRARPHLANPALLMLTSANRAGDSEKCRALNIGERLTKPIKPSALLGAILRLLEPQAIVAEPASAPVFVRQPSAGGLAFVRRPRVLLAEDNLVNQRVILALLERQGHDVVVVANGGAAVRAVQQETFDVVLMDVQMPEMNGLDATRAIRAWERDRGGHVPIAAMTAHAMKDAREDCLRAGMDDYLSKPIQLPELLRVLGRLTDGESDRPTARPAPFDLRSLMQRIGDDEELLRELDSLFQEDCPRMLEDVRQAAEAGDADSVQRAAHLLRGSVSNFAAAETVRAAQHLENIGRDGDLRGACASFHVLQESLSSFRAALDRWLAAHPV